MTPYNNFPEETFRFHV